MNDSELPLSSTVEPSVSPQSFSSSPELKDLFSALAKAQAEMKPAVLDKGNPHFKSQYASLTSCQEAYRGPLSKHGLCLIQQVFSIDEKHFIRTVLGHVSGQWISNIFKLILDRNNMQGLGSAITYARRYGANSLVGIVDTEDDDGNLASTNKPEIGKVSLAKPAISQASAEELGDFESFDTKPPISKPPEGHPPGHAPKYQRRQNGKEEYCSICMHVRPIQKAIQK